MPDWPGINRPCQSADNKHLSLYFPSSYLHCTYFRAVVFFSPPLQPQPRPLLATLGNVLWPRQWNYSIPQVSRISSWDVTWLKGMLPDRVTNCCRSSSSDKIRGSVEDPVRSTGTTEHFVYSPRVSSGVRVGLCSLQGKGIIVASSNGTRHLPHCPCSPGSPSQADG